ncbi:MULTISPECIES: TetR/AcrR family transcriptional regulator C-terminal domain-containing protein [unclassified Leptolyngbya]|uniref:TetR/AcrR family transcriptional regulator n=1 Tax=unclassified Leptolyngbya TaxID=2650499 RepID=UPI0016899918|nr:MULTISPECIES: TetR/AcrR family transcriptional regulator C-terminal domain-containing protein [unclassified Leptolyngbya]MBD1909006.1 TetR/AcrR family transcriptional regulator [Leptolyngbya sp. FACHB-8]MBD2158094.1 TetR/AcrR family transcriptional regulator [Leptolyngbya sp. FACHB-16]
MPSRDDQDFEDKRQQIIDGALQVFAQKGFEKATNKDIAIAANIGSPGLIYHYFKDKADLFRQVLEQRMPLLQLLSHNDEDMMGKPPREVLLVFGNAFLRALENPTSNALMRLVLSEAIRQPIVGELLNSIGPSRSIGFLTRYIERQIAAGTFKPLNPNAAARCFMGSLVAYALTRHVFHQPDAQELSPDMMVATAVEVFLQGIQFPAVESV